MESEVKLPTTSDIEAILMQEFHARRCSPIAPSLVLPHGWEADIAAVTKTNFVHEIEIKVSRSDFLADFKKHAYHRDIAKHDRMSSRMHGNEISSPDNDWRIRKGLKPQSIWTPNYFWFASPLGILKAEDIPEHAGWFEIGYIHILPAYANSRPYWKPVIHERKRAPRLHKSQVMTDFLKDAFLRRLTNIVTHGRGGNFDAIPKKVQTTKPTTEPILDLFSNT